MDVRYWSRATGALMRHMRSRTFTRELLASGIRADEEPRAPWVFFFLIDPRLENVSVDFGVIRFRPGNVDPYEQYVLAAFAQVRKPKRIFEIGTYDGATTLLLARNAPEAEVLTIDLPSHVDTAGMEPEEIANHAAGGVGRRFRDQAEATRIVQLLGDTRTFDFSPWFGSVDLVLIDAGHSYENAKADTATALKLLAPGGIIVWDDYNHVWPGVIRAVDETGLSAFRVMQTGFAIYDDQ